MIHPATNWRVALNMFLELSKLESKKIRLQGLKLVSLSRTLATSFQ